MRPMMTNKKIMEFIASLLEGGDATCLADSVSLIEFDRIIIGASVRYGHFDRALYEFAQKHRTFFTSKSSGIFYKLTLVKLV